MPSIKCGGCAKYLSFTEAARCTKCRASYHRGCGLLPATGLIPRMWRCPECNKCEMKNDKPGTPEKGTTEVASVDSYHSNELMDTSHMSSTRLVETPSSPFTELTKEIRLFKEEIRTELREMRQEFQQFRLDLTDIRASVKSCEDRLDYFETRLDLLQAKLDQVDSSPPCQLENGVAELKCQLNDRDQELLLNDVVISGISENINEICFNTVKVLCSKLGVSVEERDIVNVERIGVSRRSKSDSSNVTEIQRPRNLSVRFARRSMRDELLHAARARRGLTTSDLHVVGPLSRVYVNERLTKINSRLFYATRQACTLRKWRYVWTREGRILARREDGQTVHRIKSYDDIANIFGKI